MSHSSHGDGPAGPGHTHGVIDPSITTTRRGMWAISWSFAALMVTALLQVLVVVLSDSVALLADTIHNFGDAATAIPLYVAFAFARLRPNERFSYGYGRVEDLAGAAIVLIILFSAIVAGYESVDRLLHPRPVGYLGAVAAAALIGFVGNEAVAVFRIRVGKEIGSAALVADGYHARVDGLTSLAVLLGALGVYLGYPLADPIVGLGITLAILNIVRQSAQVVFVRMLDGVEPGVLDDIRHAAAHVSGVRGVTSARARWVGHRLHAELRVAVAPELSVLQGRRIAEEVQRELLDHISYLGNATIMVDPAGPAGGPPHPHS